MFKKIIFLCFFPTILMGCSNENRPDFEKGRLIIKNEYKIDIEVASTDSQREYGLMYLKKIPDDYGMLFVYDEAGYVAMWMKNTYVSLDMYFINEDRIITQIERATNPLSLEHIKSKKTTKYVLETRAGFADDKNIEIGSSIAILKN